MQNFKWEMVDTGTQNPAFEWGKNFVVGEQVLGLITGIRHIWHKKYMQEGKEKVTLVDVSVKQAKLNQQLVNGNYTYFANVSAGRRDKFISSGAGVGDYISLNYLGVDAHRNNAKMIEMQISRQPNSRQVPDTLGETPDHNPANHGGPASFEQMPAAPAQNQNQAMPQQQNQQNTFPQQQGQGQQSFNPANPQVGTMPGQQNQAMPQQQNQQNTFPQQQGQGQQSFNPANPQVGTMPGQQNQAMPQQQNQQNTFPQNGMPDIPQQNGMPNIPTF